MFVIRKISVGIKTRSGALFTSWFPPVKSARVPSFAGRGGGWRERLTNSLRSHRETVKMRPERPLKSLITISARKASEKPWIHALAWGTRAMRRRWASSREKKNTPPPHDTFIPTFLWKIFHWKSTISREKRSIVSLSKKRNCPTEMLKCNYKALPPYFHHSLTLPLLIENTN